MRGPGMLVCLSLHRGRVRRCRACGGASGSPGVRRPRAESSPAATQAGPHLFMAVTQQLGKRPKCLVSGTRLSLAALGGPAAGPGAAASFLRDRQAGGHRVLGRLLSLGAGGSRPGAAVGACGPSSQQGTLREDGKSLLLQFRNGETEAHVREKPAPRVPLQGTFCPQLRGGSLFSRTPPLEQQPPP